MTESPTKKSQHRRRRRIFIGTATGAFLLLAGGALLIFAAANLDDLFDEVGEELAGAPSAEPDPPAPAPAPAPAQPSAPRVTVSGWEALARAAREASGYGLYSYLLIPVRDEASRPRYIAALSALQQQVDTIAEVEGAGFKRYEINITYLPVRSALAEGAEPDEILERYDFARSKRILSYVEPDFGAGPYLISYLQPLSGPPPAGSQVLVQNLSWVPPELVGLWVSNFTREVRSPRTWNETSLRKMMLVSRTFLSVVSGSVETGTEAVERLVRLKKALASE